MDYHQKYLKYKNKYIIAKSYYNNKNGSKLNLINELSDELVDLNVEEGEEQVVGVDEGEEVDMSVESEDADSDVSDGEHDRINMDELALLNKYKTMKSNITYKLNQSGGNINDVNVHDHDIQNLLLDGNKKSYKNIMELDNLTDTPSQHEVYGYNFK